MDIVELNLAQIVAAEVADYARAMGYKDTSHLLTDAAGQLYSVIVVPDVDHPVLKKARLMLLARLVAGYVVIEEDTTDRPLYRELLRCGIPRERIILRYAGETLPE